MGNEPVVGRRNGGTDGGVGGAEGGDFGVGEDEEGGGEGVGEGAAGREGPSARAAMSGGAGAGVDEVFALDGEAGAAEGGAGEGESALRGAFADTNGPAGLVGGRVEGEGAAATALEAGGGDAPVG